MSCLTVGVLFVCSGQRAVLGLMRAVQAASMGCTSAQYMLGLCFDHGCGTEHNLRDAVQPGPPLSTGVPRYPVAVPIVPLVIVHCLFEPRCAAPLLALFPASRSNRSLVVAKL
jgi:hypothetical protein